MKQKFISILLLSLYINSEAVNAQSAEIELNRITGECNPRYSSRQDSLVLYASPDLRSKKKNINYKKGWHIPHSDELTRIIKLGKVTALENGQKINYDYLYYLGEGYAKLRFKNKEYELPIIQNPNLQIETHPEIQGWVKLMYKDKSSPGWLLLNDEQVKVHAIEC